jgi:ketosteroid isomerase-like protein
VRTGALALLAVAAACGGSAAKGPAAPKQQPDIDPAQAESDAKGLVTEVYQSIGHGDTDSLMTLMSDQLVVFGPRRGDALATRQDALVALRAIVDAEHKRPVKSAQLAVVPGPGGHSAVAFDTIETGGRTLAVLALLTNSDDIWLVQAASLAEPPAAATLTKELARDAVVPPALAGPAKVDDYAAPVVEQWKKELAAQDAWGAALASSDDGLYIGPGQGDVARGKQDIKRAWKKRTDANTREVAIGDVTAGSTPDGRMAWVSAPVARAEGKEMLPLRMFAVYRRRGDAWKLCALQESVAIDAPGAGAKYKAMMPAAAAPPPPPPPPANDDAPPPKKKKAAKPAKKKIKPPPADDDTTTADDAAPPPPKKKPKKKVKPPPSDDDDTVVTDDDAAPKKPRKPKKKAKPPPSDDGDDDGN